MENQQEIEVFGFSIPIEKNEKIIQQAKKNICIIKNNDKLRLGYFCKIKLKSKILTMLITLKDIINEKEKDNNILLTFDEKKI